MTLATLPQATRYATPCSTQYPLKLYSLNYRTFKGKYDGNRPLAVFVHWRVQDERLVPELVFNRPLLVRGDEVADNLRRCLSTLDIEDTDGITPENVRYPQMVFGL